MPNEQPDQLSIDDSGPRVGLAVPAMTRVRALLVALIPTVMLILAEDQSRQNKSEQPDSFGVEPSVLKQNLSNVASWAGNTIWPSTVEVAVAARTFSHGRRPLGSIQST